MKNCTSAHTALEERLLSYTAVSYFDVYRGVLSTNSGYSVAQTRHRML